MLKIQDTQSRMSFLIYMMQRIRLLVILLRLEERSLQWKRLWPLYLQKEFPSDDNIHQNKYFAPLP